MPRPETEGHSRLLAVESLLIPRRRRTPRKRGKKAPPPARPHRCSSHPAPWRERGPNLHAPVPRALTDSETMACPPRAPGWIRKCRNHPAARALLQRPVPARPSRRAYIDSGQQRLRLSSSSSGHSFSLFNLFLRSRLANDSAEFLQPEPQPLHPFANADARNPTRFLAKFSRVRDIILLICRAPLREARLDRLAPQLSDQIQQFQQTDR